MPKGELKQYEFDLLILAIREAYRTKSILAFRFPYDIIKYYIPRMSKVQRSLTIKEITKLETQYPQNISDGWLLFKCLLDDSKYSKHPNSDGTYTIKVSLGDNLLVEAKSVLRNPYKFSQGVK